MRLHLELIVALISAATFLLGAHHSPPSLPAQPRAQLKDHIVISAPVQLVIYAGDRFLAADLELIRLATTASESAGKDSAAYLIRAHRLVSQLNPCHEDNYYLGNALLTWGGAPSQGDELLRRATDCRQWDEIPPFLYGMNQYYFHHNKLEAQRALDIAASRSPENYAALKKASVMIGVEDIPDDRMARDYLQHQHDASSDEQLRQMLAKRIVRLSGLIDLRSAQQQFEHRYGRPLATPQELLTKGILQGFPHDPLGIGYEFRDGTFFLRELRVAGMENKR